MQLDCLTNNWGAALESLSTDGAREYLCLVVRPGNERLESGFREAAEASGLTVFTVDMRRSRGPTPVPDEDHPLLVPNNDALLLLPDIKNIDGMLREQEY